MGALVLLLKSDVILSRSGDSYDAVLSEHGYSPLSIAVIDHSLVDMDSLRDIVCSGSMRYEGVIFTSGRAVDAWIEAVSMVSEEQLSGSWLSTSFYVVGPKTSDAIIKARESAPHGFPSQEHIHGATDTGSGERLAKLIMQRSKDLSSDPASISPFLCLTGDKSLETVPTILREGGYRVDVQQVYETHQRPEFAQDLQVALESRPSSEDTDTDEEVWAVFFAPSTARMAIATLESFFLLPYRQVVPSSPKNRRIKFAAIGPTTLKYLTESHQPSFYVEATASSPTPVALLEAMLASKISRIPDND